MLRAVGTLTLLLMIAGCATLGPSDASQLDASSVSGLYALVSVNEQALPCCTESDAAGLQTSIVSGSLRLDAVAPERFAATPGGIVPAACVHEVPNDAHIDANGVVTLPDSSTYRIPTCAELHPARYLMVVVHRHAQVDGTSFTTADTLSGSYAWSDAASGESRVMRLIDSGLAGTVSLAAAGVELRLQRSHFGMPSADPVYGFARIAAR